MKPYSIEVSFFIIVMAGDEESAAAIAEDNAHDAFRDTGDLDFGSPSEVKTMTDVHQAGWCGESIPYGSDDDARLRDILAAIADEPTVDDKTIDMFAEAKA
jgi:hypothetical protein